MSKRPKWNSLTTFGSASSLSRLGALFWPGLDLHDLGVAVAARQLHDAQPVAPDGEAEGFGVDRDGVAKGPVGGQVGAVEADGQFDALRSDYRKSPSLTMRRLNRQRRVDDARCAAIQSRHVIPANAGIRNPGLDERPRWMPACAGMTTLADRAAIATGIVERQS